MTKTDIQKHTTSFSGKPYVMVSGKVLLAHEDNPDALSIETEIAYMDADSVTVKARATTRKGVFTGHATSYLKSGSPQERKTPLEVAETSAVGRALSFAGYATEHGIASAEEMSRVQPSSEPPPQPTAAPQKPAKAQKPAPAPSGGPIPPPSELQARYKAAAELGRAKGLLAQMQVAKHEIDPSDAKGIDHLPPVQQWRVVEALEGVLAGA
jgi:hypothetical protein